MLKMLKKEALSAFPRPEGMNELIYDLLLKRGIRDAEAAEAFLVPSKKQLRDPMLLSGMADAVRRIESAISNGERVTIWGDYDVDGVCASSVLYLYLKTRGVEAKVYLPSRHEEGYGLNEEGLRKLCPETDLLITVDCGISSKELISLAQELGTACIVTDHHRPGPELPDCPVINPLLNNYPFGSLCGAGVAFKLVHALGGLDAAMEYIDLAALATVADIVSLTDENRAVVKLGLDRMNAAPRLGVKELLRVANSQQGEVTTQIVAYRLAPRLNAAGRLGSAMRAFNLLTTEDAFLAFALADELEGENRRRQEMEKKICLEAEEQLKRFDFTAHRIITVRGENWNHGVIGLAAGHLCQKYHYPVIVFAEKDGLLTGSCRSIEGVDIFETLTSAKELTVRCGGHSQAAGVTLAAENYESFREALDSYLFAHTDRQTYVPRVYYDAETDFAALDARTVCETEKLAPFGCDNPEPLLRARAKIVDSQTMGRDGAHLRMILEEGAVRLTGVYFSAGDRRSELGEEADFLFTPQINRWNGREDVQLMIKESAPSGRREIGIPQALGSDFLFRLLACGAEGYRRQAEMISEAELKQLLSQNLTGVAVLCADAEQARRVLALAGEDAPDLKIGQCGALQVNTLLVCPLSSFLDAPSLRTLVLAGLPVPDDVPETLRVCALEGSAPAYASLPDTDGMREVYKVLRRPFYSASMTQLEEILSRETGLSPLACRASVEALRDLKLLEYTEKPRFHLSLLPPRKVDPEDSVIFRAVQALRRFSGK